MTFKISEIQVYLLNKTCSICKGKLFNIFLQSQNKCSNKATHIF